MWKDWSSGADLLTLQGKVAAAIIARKAEDAKATKDQLRAYAEKAGFRLEELFGKRGSKGSGVAKYRNPKDASQTWTGRGRKPNWLIDAVKKGAKIESSRSKSAVEILPLRRKYQVRPVSCDGRLADIRAAAATCSPRASFRPPVSWHARGAQSVTRLGASFLGGRDQFAMTAAGSPYLP